MAARAMWHGFLQRASFSEWFDYQKVTESGRRRGRSSSLESAEWPAFPDPVAPDLRRQGRSLPVSTDRNVLRVEIDRAI